MDEDQEQLIRIIAKNYQGVAKMKTGELVKNVLKKYIESVVPGG